MNITAEGKLLEHLVNVYGDINAHKVFDRVMDAVTRFKHASSQIPTDDREDINEKDVILIT